MVLKHRAVVQELVRAQLFVVLVVEVQRLSYEILITLLVKFPLEQSEGTKTVVPNSASGACPQR